MTQFLTIKKGATFRMLVRMPDGLEGASFEAPICAQGSRQHVADLNVREIDVEGACLLELEASTDTWPLTALSLEVRATVEGEIAISETLMVKVTR